MKVIETSLPGVLIFEPRVFRDERGYFCEVFHQQRYRTAAGIDLEFVQDNVSRSLRNVLRGLHLQTQHAQGKLISVSQGEVWDVVVDVNPESSTFRQHVGVSLDAESQRQLYCPPGYAHGFCVLSDFVDFHYKCSDYYYPEFEQGIAWDDPELAIPWPVSNPRMSDRDRGNRSLNEFLATLSNA